MYKLVGSNIENYTYTFGFNSKNHYGYHRLHKIEHKMLHHKNDT